MKIRVEVPNHPDGEQPEGWAYYWIEGDWIPRTGEYCEWLNEQGQLVEFVVVNIMWTPHRDYEVMVVLGW